MAQQPEQVIDIPGLGPVAFPASMTPADINAAADGLYRAKNPSTPPPTTSWIDTAVEWLPTAGGVIGGLAGGMVGGPPGAVMGAALGGAGGEGYRRSISAARGGPIAPSMGADVKGMTGEAIKQGLMEGGGQVAGLVAKPLLQAAGRHVMQSALKPAQRLAAKAVAKGQAVPVVETLLKEGVNVTPGGVNKLNRIINASNEEIANAVTGTFGQVNPFKVTKPLGDLAKRAATQVNPASDLDTISRVGQEFLESRGGQALTVPEAQALKQGTYRSLGNKAYGELKGMEIEAQKALARGLKDEIADEVGGSLAGIKGKLGLPGGIDITAANAREGAALTALDAVSKRVATSGNRDVTGLAGLAISHPITFLTVLMDRSPVVKSMLARGLYQSAERASGVSAQTIRAAVAAIATSDDEEGTP